MTLSVCVHGLDDGGLLKINIPDVHAADRYVSFNAILASMIPIRE